MQRLQKTYKEQRFQFCLWLLDQDEDLIKRVIGSDEKIFVLQQKHHRKKDGRWSAEYPCDIAEFNNRNDKKK